MAVASGKSPSPVQVSGIFLSTYRDICYLAVQLNLFYMQIMMRRVLFLLIVWVGLSSLVLADGFREQFRAAFKAGDLAGAERVLTEWEKATPKDPDLYVARFNFLLNKAARRTPVPATPVVVAAGAPAPPPRPQAMMVSYDPATMAQAAAVLKQGIALAPERLDMRMGLAKSYEMAGQPAPLLQTIRETLEARKNGGKPWLWRDGVPLPGPENAFVPAAIEPFASNYWKQPGDKGLENGRPIAELMEQYFPQNSLGYFNMGVYYAHLHKTQESYEKMQQADALDPNDISTLMNLTRMAIELKQKDKAMAYQERLRKLPNGGSAADSFASAMQKL